MRLRREREPWSKKQRYDKRRERYYGEGHTKGDVDSCRDTAAAVVKIGESINSLAHRVYKNGKSSRKKRISKGTPWL